MRKLSRNHLIALGLVLTALAVGCSSGSSGSKDSTENASETPTVPSSNGDSCSDPTGDLDFSGVAVTDPTALSSLAGIDLTASSAQRNGDKLEIRFEASGPIGLVPDPTFVVAQGAPLQPLSYELRAVEKNGTWQILLVTWPQGEKRETLPVTPTVAGDQVTFSVPLSDLPPIASVLQFGSSATGPDGTTLVIDDCSSLTQSGTGSGTTVPIVTVPN